MRAHMCCMHIASMHRLLMMSQLRAPVAAGTRTHTLPSSQQQGAVHCQVASIVRSQEDTPYHLDLKHLNRVRRRAAAVRATWLRCAPLPCTVD